MHIGQSGIFNTDIISSGVVGRLRPKVVCNQLNVDTRLGPQEWTVILPSHHSNIDQRMGGSVATPVSPSGFLNFGSGLATSTSANISPTIAMYFSTESDDDNISVSRDVSIFNMKLWIDDMGAFSGLPVVPYVQMLSSGVWHRNFTMTSGQYGAFEVQKSLPDQPNVMRIDGAPWMSGIGFDRSQIVYANIILPSGEYQTGRYGANGNFHWRFSYDWTSEFSHIHVGVGSGTHCDY